MLLCSKVISEGVVNGYNAVQIVGGCYFFCEMGDLDELTTDGGAEGQRISTGECGGGE